MPTWLRHVGSALLVALLLAYAHSPAALSGFVGEDYATIVAVERIAGPGSVRGGTGRLEALFSVPGVAGHPVAAASLVLSAVLWSPAAGGPLALLMPRLENLLLLCLAAWVIGRFVRRLLWPWVGTDHGRAAGRAASLLVLLHPASVAAVASLGSRGDLIALGLGVLGANLFLKSRQEHNSNLTACSACCAVVAGLSSGIAYGLPVLLAAAELISARRYRPASVRRRTAATTLIVFAACVGLAPFMRSVVLGLGPGAALGLASRDPLAVTSVSLVRFGAALFPVNETAGGALGFLVAGAVLLIALQPVPIAARSAPRLWGWLLTAAVAAVVLWEACSEGRVVRAEDFTHAATLLPLGAVLGVALGVASTAVFGLRRTVLPIVVATGWAFVGHQNAVALAASADVFADLRGDLLEARQTWGHDVQVLVLDPPRHVQGIDALEGALPWAVDPIFAGLPLGAGGGWVRALTSEALVAFAREPEFTELRSHPLIAVVPGYLVDPELEPGADEQGHTSRLALPLPPPRPSTGMRSWFREGRAAHLDLETVTMGALLVRCTPKSNTDEPPVLAWRATEALALQGALEGAWNSVGETPEAVFDLSSSVSWLLGGRVQQIWSERGWSRIHEARLALELPEPSGISAPRVRGEDWVFEGSFEAPEETWRVVLLDLATLESAALPARQTVAGELEILGAARRVSAAFLSGRGPVAWSLERLVEGQAVERIRGRRVLKDE